MDTVTRLPLLDQLKGLFSDVDAACTPLVKILTDPKNYKEILAWRGETAQYLINLLQTHLMCYPAESPNRRIFLRVLIKLSRLSGLYPECLVRDDVQLIGTDPIAAGRFGDVWRGSMHGHATIAVKILRVYVKSDAEKLLKEFSTEAVTWRQLSHPNVLPFYGVFHLNNNRARVCLISPWMENGNIVQFLQQVPDANRVSLILDIAQGLEYLHKSRPSIIHGDLKGVNILITQEHKACLADFGLSSIEDSQAVALSSVSGGRTTGTSRWQAPELLDPQRVDLEGQGRNSPASDIYSFACVCYEIFSGNVPFYKISNDFRVVLAVITGERPPRPPYNLSKIRGVLGLAIWDLIESCWKPQPHVRLTASEIVKRLRSRTQTSLPLEPPFEVSSSLNSTRTSPPSSSDPTTTTLAASSTIRATNANPVPMTPEPLLDLLLTKEGKEMVSFALGTEVVATSRPTYAQEFVTNIYTFMPRWIRSPRLLLVGEEVNWTWPLKSFRVLGCTIDPVSKVKVVERMNLWTYDLVLINVVMLDVGIVSLPSMIRQGGHIKTPIIAITPMTSNSERNGFMSYYSSVINDILPKPFTQDDLLSILEKHLTDLQLSPLSTGISPVSDNPFERAFERALTFGAFGNPSMAAGVPDDTGDCDEFIAALGMREQQYGMTLQNPQPRQLFTEALSSSGENGSSMNRGKRRFKGDEDGRGGKRVRFNFAE